MTTKLIAVLTVAVAFSLSPSARASEKNDSSSDSLKQEVGELRQVVTELLSYVKKLEARLQRLERAVSNYETHGSPLLFPLEIERGMQLDAEETEQKTIKRLIDEGHITPVEPLR